MIIIKNEETILKMKIVGKIVALVQKKIKKIIKEGISLIELDNIAEKEIFYLGAKPSFKNYNGFPSTICTSVDNVIIHGIPSKKKLKQGEIISIDIGAYYNGFHGDAAFTVPVGIISKEKQNLIAIAEKSFFEGFKMAKIGNRLGDISYAIQNTVENEGYSVIKEFAGHGIGANLHEEPSVPNFGKKGKGIRLEKGMTLAIEPMVNMGKPDINILNDGWTVVTRDGKPSAHYENTIVITENNPLILTCLNN